MTIVTSSYRPKRAPRKKRPRTYPKNMPLIVTPGLMKKRLKEPVINPQRTSAIVEPKKPRNTMLAHLLDGYDPEAHRRTGEKADELFREIVRRAANKRD